MDLYEALKSGTSEEELLKAFHKDLESARDRIAADKAKEKEDAAKAEHLADCREYLAEAVADYVNALTGSKLDESDIDSIIKRFETVEKDMKLIDTSMDKLVNAITTELNKPFGVKITTHTFDDDIISNFLKSLK